MPQLRGQDGREAGAEKGEEDRGVTPLIAEMAALVPEQAAEMMWFDMHSLWNSVREDYDHTLAIEGIQENLPFPFCGVVFFDEYDNKVLVAAKEGEHPEKPGKRGLIIDALSKGRGVVNKYAPFFADPHEEGIESGISIFFAGKEHYKDERLKQAANASLVAISFWLKSMEKLSMPIYKAQSKKNQAKRIRQGKKPLFEWTTVVLEPRHSSSESLGGTHATPRLHDVRGHWVVRNNKRFWRKPHKRGDASKGVIFKDYQIKGQEQRA